MKGSNFETWLPHNFLGRNILYSRPTNKLESNLTGPTSMFLWSCSFFCQQLLLLCFRHLQRFLLKVLSLWFKLHVIRYDYHCFMSHIGPTKNPKKLWLYQWIQHLKPSGFEGSNLSVKKCVYTFYIDDETSFFAWMNLHLLWLQEMEPIHWQLFHLYTNSHPLALRSPRIPEGWARGWRSHFKPSDPNLGVFSVESSQMESSFNSSVEIDKKNMHGFKALLFHDLYLTLIFLLENL